MFQIYEISRDISAIKFLEMFFPQGDYGQILQFKLRTFDEFARDLIALFLELLGQSARSTKVHSNFASHSA